MGVIKDIILKRIQDTKVVAILRNLSHDDNFFVMDHLLEAGIANFEVSLTTENGVKVIEEAVKKYGDKAIVGAGTVMTERQALDVIEVGAKFLFAPNLSEKIVSVANKHDIFMTPGVFSPTEIYAATEMGCSLVKLFPASTLGSDYIKQILSPLEGVNIIAVGGIDHQNMDDYLKAGACAVGIGSSMTPKKMIADRDSEALLAHIKQYIR